MKTIKLTGFNKLIGEDVELTYTIGQAKSDGKYVAHRELSSSIRKVSGRFNTYEGALLAVIENAQKSGFKNIAFMS